MIKKLFLVLTLSFAPARILVETSINSGKITIEILDGDRVIAASVAIGERTEAFALLRYPVKALLIV